MTGRVATALVCLLLSGCNIFNPLPPERFTWRYDSQGRGYWVKDAAGRYAFDGKDMRFIDTDWRNLK